MEEKNCKKMSFALFQEEVGSSEGGELCASPKEEVK